MKKHSANYSCTKNNFFIQNINKKELEFLPAIWIINNLIQRVRPTLIKII